jgi:hypothetical protein
MTDPFWEDIKEYLDTLPRYTQEELEKLVSGSIIIAQVEKENND